MRSMRSKRTTSRRRRRNRRSERVCWKWRTLIPWDLIHFRRKAKQTKQTKQTKLGRRTKRPVPRSSEPSSPFSRAMRRFKTMESSRVLRFFLSFLCSQLGISQYPAGRHPRGERSVLLRSPPADGGTCADRLGLTEPRLRRGGAEWRGRQRGKLGIRFEMGGLLRNRCGKRTEMARRERRRAVRRKLPARRCGGMPAGCR